MVQYYHGTVIFDKFYGCNVILDDSQLESVRLDGTNYFKQGCSLGYGETKVIHHKCDGILFGSRIQGDNTEKVWLLDREINISRNNANQHFEYDNFIDLWGLGYPPAEIWQTFAPVDGDWIYYWWIRIEAFYRPGRDAGMTWNASSLYVRRTSKNGISIVSPARRRSHTDIASLGNRFSVCEFSEFPQSWGFDDWISLLRQDGRISYTIPSSSSSYYTMYTAKLRNNPPHLSLNYLQYCRDVLRADLEFLSERNYVLSDMSQAIADQSEDLDINSIAYAKEALEYINAALHVVSQGVDLSLLQKALSGDILSISKVAADGVLSGSYGLNLTIRDTQELIDFLTRKNDYPIRIARSSGSHSISAHGIYMIAEYHLKCRYATTDHGIRGILERMYHSDTFPTSANMWDLVPYSFVIDWVFPVDTALEGLDTEARLSVLPIKQVLRSDKYKLVFSPAWCAQVLGCTGTLEFSTYERYSMNTLPPIFPRFNGNTHFNSWVQAGALIVQRM